MPNSELAIGKEQLHSTQMNDLGVSVVRRNNEHGSKLQLSGRQEALSEKALHIPLHK